MGSPEVCIIAAVSENRAIGKDNKLLWRIPEDLKQFKELTTGHPIIMGRKTFESIGRPLPDRLNIVITSDQSFKAHGCTVCHSLDEAIETAKSKDQDRIFIIGGGKVYEESIGLVDKLYLTLVEGEHEGDTFFPDYSNFNNVLSERASESEGVRYRFLELKKS